MGLFCALLRMILNTAFQMLMIPFHREMPGAGGRSLVLQAAQLMRSSLEFAIREGVFAETKEGKCKNKREIASFKEFKKSAS